MREFHVLNLGAGVQSTALALLANEGKLVDTDGKPVKLDCAIFADTGEEPVPRALSLRALGLDQSKRVVPSAKACAVTSVLTF